MPKSATFKAVATTGGTMLKTFALDWHDHINKPPSEITDKLEQLLNSLRAHNLAQILMTQSGFKGKIPDSKMPGAIQAVHDQIHRLLDPFAVNESFSCEVLPHPQSDESPLFIIMIRRVEKKA